MGFGEDQVSFGWFSWEFLSFCCFFLLMQFLFGVFLTFFGVSVVFILVHVSHLVGKV